jgi:hypothetical protein
LTLVDFSPQSSKLPPGRLLPGDPTMSNSLLTISRRGLLAGALSVSIARADEISRQALQAPADAATSAGSWLFALAQQTATYAVPIVAMYNLRATTAIGPDAKVSPNDIWRVDHIANPTVAAQTGYVTPNVNVIYGFGFMDLGQQPIILSAPDSEGRYYMVQIVDMWTNAFAYVGGIATGYKGGTYALVGPGWQGQLPPNVKRIDCPTRWVELQPRVYVKNAADLAGAQKVLHAIKVMGLAQYTGNPAPHPGAYRYDAPKIDPMVASSHMQFADPLQFWEIFSAAMNENPPPKSEVEAVLPQFKYLGIELGKAWRRDAVPPPILQAMSSAAKGIGPMMIALLRIAGRPSNGWIIPPANVGMAGADYPSRAIVAVNGLTANIPQEAIYYTSISDDNGVPLSGGKRYGLTLKDSMPCIRAVPPGFWSVTAYESATGFTVPNALDRYALGSDNELKRNADGSFTIHVQQDNPGPDRESNWLPISAAAFYLIIRVYAPVREIAEGLKNRASFEGPPPIIALN